MATPAKRRSATLVEHGLEYKRLLEELRGWRGPSGQRIHLNIADVAFFYCGSMFSWYFTSHEDGTLRRKNRASLSNMDFAKMLLRHHDASRAETSQPLALAVLISGDGGTSVAPLTAASVRWLLLSERSRRDRLLAVTRFVQPRGVRESVLRVDWRTQLRGVEQRSSRSL